MHDLFVRSAIMIAFLCLLSLGRQAQACSCRGSPLEEKLAEAEHVALVEIRKVRRTLWFPSQRAHFDVVRSFKGEMEGIADLRSGNGAGDCGVPLRTGARYLIYLPPRSNHIGICYGVLGPLRKSSAAGPAGPALAEFLDSLAAHLQRGTPLVEPADDMFEEPGSRGGPPPPPPPPEN